MNWHGEVIGINTLIAYNVGQSAGICFAIPVNTAEAVLNDLMTLGRVRRPALGVRTIPITPELADQMGLAADSGLLIVQVVPGGAADRAGLRGGNERAYIGNVPITLGGDLIVAIDGQQGQDQQDLSQVMNSPPAADTARVTIYRAKNTIVDSVTRGKARAAGSTIPAACLSKSSKAGKHQLARLVVPMPAQPSGTDRKLSGSPLSPVKPNNLAPSRSSAFQRARCSAHP